METLKKSLLFLFTFCSIQQILKAQSFVDEHKIRKVVVGVNELNYNNINAAQYTFDYRIYKMYVDTTSNKITIQLRDVNSDRRSIRNVGEYMVLDLTNNDVKWKNKITYTEDFLNQNANILLEVYGNRSYKINMQTGKSDTIYDNRIFYIDKQSKTGLVFIRLTRGETSAKLLGVNLTDGTIKWKKDIKKDYSRCKLSHLNDSTLLFIASGLHTINPGNGKGWDYNAKTGDKNYRDPDQKAAQSSLGGVERSGYDVFYGNSLLHGAESNVLCEGNYLYYAAQEKIVSINKLNGQINWSFDFIKEDAGVSWLHLKDSILYMVSAGYGIKKEERIQLGKPFIAAFNKNTGQKIFQYFLPKKDVIISTKSDEQHLFILYNEGISSYKFSNNQFANKKTSQNEDEENLWFLENDIYLNYGDSLSPDFRLLDTTKPYVVTNTHLLLEFENDLTLPKISDDRSVFAVIAKKNGFKIVSQQGKSEMFMLDEYNKVIARFNAPSNSVLIKNKLYGIDDDTLVETDLTEIMK